MLDLHDFGPNPHVPAYGEFGAVTIRWAKGTAGSGPRRRTVTAARGEEGAALPVSRPGLEFEASPYIHGL
jgi:hypothetical protein